MGRGAKVAIAVLVVAIVGLALVGVVVSVGGDDSATVEAGPSPALSADEQRTVRPEATPAAASRLQVEGSSEGPDGEAMRVAIADVDAFWSRTFERTFDADYETVSGGFYAVTDSDSSVPCTDDPSQVEGNAFYCPTEDVVAWDADGLIPHMVDNYGPLGLGLVIAHEWGHAVQMRAGESEQTPVLVLEQQADCYAGAWVADVRSGGSKRWFVVDDRTLDLALAGFLELRDTPGMTRQDAGAHGTAFDRMRAFQEGMDDGAGACGYTADALAPRLVDIPFLNSADYSSGGNLPLQDSFDLTAADLEDFWSAAWSEVGGRGSFDPPELEVFTDGQAPSCDDRIGLSGEVFYCPSGNRLAVQEDGVVAKLHGTIGDFALGEVLGSAYSLAAMHQLDALAGPRAAVIRRADCLAGAWSASVFSGNRPSASLQLSPGDLDEAVAALLATAVNGKASATGSGSDRVAAYRDGFMNGSEACLG